MDRGFSLPRQLYRKRKHEYRQCPRNPARLADLKMKTETQKEIVTATANAIVDVVRGQVAKGLPKQGVSKARHGAVVADVVVELLESFPAPAGEDETRWQRLVLRAAFSGSILNASQLRQELEKAGVLEKDVPISSEYSVE